MNGVLIIAKDHGADHWGPDSMLNTIGICDCILQDKKDGDEVEVTIKGVLVEHDGMRFIAAHTVDGKDVEEFPQMDGSPQDEKTREDMMTMDSTDALDHFMNNKGKY